MDVASQFFFFLGHLRYYQQLSSTKNNRISLHFISLHFTSVSMGLTVSRQTAKNLPVNRQKRGNFTVNRQKAVVIRRQTVLRSFKSQCFSLSSRTAGSQRIFLTGTTCFKVPKYIQFTVFSTHLLLNCHYNQLVYGRTSGFKILMINCTDKSKKGNINFNSWKKFTLDNL